MKVGNSGLGWHLEVSTTPGYGLYSKAYSRVPYGCLSSSHCIPIPVSKKEEKGRRSWPLSLKILLEKCIYHFCLHFIDQGLITRPDPHSREAEKFVFITAEQKPSKKTEILLILKKGEMDLEAISIFSHKYMLCNLGNTHLINVWYS